MVKWNAESESRLFLVLLAVHGRDLKLNYEKIAEVFGEGT